MKIYFVVLSDVVYTSSLVVTEKLWFYKLKNDFISPQLAKNMFKLIKITQLIVTYNITIGLIT